ncbi:MAG: DUF2851 family protein [Cyclobacteriaceae bacterium]|nr:DUF2851 family protein [Cyclobacteriaceae bacterium]
MQESFIQHLWSLQYFDKTNLLTTHGEQVEIFEPGQLNRDAGPDFSNARLRIGDIQWVGNVEIHLNSSGWYEHHHEADASYDTVILHVVWKEDKPVARRDGSRMPTLELRGRVNEGLIRSYRQLIGSSFSIPCQNTFPQVERIRKQDMLGKALVHRLQRKADEVISLLHTNGGNWEETTYQWLAHAFGFKINAEPFLQLARAVPQRLIWKMNQLSHVEALLFGQAGFLEAPKGDGYYLELQREYRLLSHKHVLSGSRLTRTQWRFLRLRPPNFPSLRLAQFSALVFHRRALCADLLGLPSLDALVNFFLVQPSVYWADHYQFSKTTAHRGHEMGRASIDVLIINTVIPLMAAYARQMDEPGFMERAVQWLESLPPEENSITRRWTDLGQSPLNSFDAQGQIELFNTFCQRKRCLDCTIGTAIVRPTGDELHIDSP